MRAGRQLFPLVFLTLPACGGDGLLVPGDADIARLQAVAGDGQEAVAGEPVPDPLVVEALDAAGRPVSGARIAFRFINADGEVTPGMAETGEDGRAAAEVTLGGSVGDQVVEARLDGGGLAVEFRLTALQPDDRGGQGSGGGDDEGRGGKGGNGDGGNGGQDDGDDDSGGGGEADEDDDEGDRGGGGDDDAGGQGSGKGTGREGGRDRERND